MTQQSLDISALVGSRICHDLISPLGAIANGVELMGLSGAPPSPEMALIAESVENANARIKMFRIAYGAARADQQVAAADVTSIMAGLSKGGRLQYDWQVTGDAPRVDVRFALLLIQALETALAFGGTITVSQSGGKWRVAGHGSRLAYDPHVWAYIEDPLAPAAPVSAAHVHFKLIAQLRADHAYDLTCDMSDTDIILQF